MRANYHAHTWRCNHATGTEEEYVKSAVEQGFDILGFSDHAPQFFSEGYVSKIRMDTQELSNYCKVIRDLRDRYSDQIRIHVPEKAYALYRDGEGCATNPWYQYLDRIVTY